MIKNWTEFDLRLRAIAPIDLKLTGYARERDEAKLSADTVFKAMADPILTSRDAIAEEMEIYFKANRKEIDKKSIELDFGRAGMRLSPPKLALRKGWKWERVLAAVKAKFADWSPFISVKEALNKEVLKANLTESVLADIGLKLKQDEEFFIETYPDKVAKAA
jgi:hypothetical protein